MKRHVVSQGEYTSQLAWRYGVTADAIWHHPKNQELRGLRDSMNILAPGDIVFIPTAPKQAMPLQRGGQNTYCSTPPKVTTTLILRHEGAPVKNEAYRVTGAGDVIEGTTDGRGALTIEVPVDTETIVVRFDGRDLTYMVAVGALDPITEPSGVRMRLANLGLLRAPSSGDGVPIDPDELLRGSIAAFQEAHALEVTGEVNDDTRAALRAAYGS